MNNLDISKETIRNIANLANISIDDNDIDFYKESIEQLLDLTSNINNLNLDIDENSNLHLNTNVFREDIAKPFNNVDLMLKNTNNIKDGFVFVPEIMKTKED